jgi:hypothetical protein
MDQLATIWGDLEPLLGDLRAHNVCPELVHQAQALLQQHRDEIRYQLAAIVDVGTHLCRGDHALLISYLVRFKC